MNDRDQRRRLSARELLTTSTRRTPAIMERPMSFTAPQIGLLVLRFQDAFLETPHLRLSLNQAVRQFDVDSSASHEVLDTLVGAQVLARTRDGIYYRRIPEQAHAA
jgi:hypothetical protein